jgi:hypothetical protein
MPLPPLTRDYITVGGAQTFIGTSYTWGQMRTAVYAAPHATGSSDWGNFGHAIDYYDTGFNGIEAVESGNRLFRGQIFSTVGYNDYSTPNPTPGAPDIQRFFYGSFFESPPGSGIFVPGIGSGLDIEEQATILGGATFVGSGSSVTTGPTSYDNSDPAGQNIGTTALGTVSSVTLSF